MRAYERLLKYVKIHTTSDPNSGTHPSTLRQFDLAKILVEELKELGLTIRERKMADGGRLIIAVDDLTRFSGHVDGFQYRECFAVRLGPNGERAGRDGDINALEWYKRWYSTGAGIENYIADDIQRAAREAKKK